MAAHLAVNGYCLQANELEAYRFVMDLYVSGRFRIAELDTWLRGHVMTPPPEH